MKISESVTKIMKKRLTFYNKYIAKKTMSKFQTPYKLNVGCGSNKHIGWLNLDLEGDPNIVDIFWNAAQKFEFMNDNSCSLIYSEHFLEHLPIDQGVNFLAECYRLLENGGSLRIAMPSLEYVIAKYNSEDWHSQDWLTWPEYQFIKSRAEMMNICFRWWGHQWLYDCEELHRRLYEAGFEKVKDLSWGYSDVPELQNRETRKDSLLICEAQK
ncbi:class I SAM-dependent methyltransferase [Chlorogloea sp. CCALA 695]|uniref:class I SAM-dependent methyltransferase n=1 Tax=Chlorogloea sp. CCALA 695 TaxID=2107693 RepID=UPI0018ED7356|nr:methyltransferase domain-containing protein [Chlorogloea sp. CCALA 695]